MNKIIKNKNIKGVLFMLLASLFFAINDAIVKYSVNELGSELSLFNVVFIRGIFTSVLIIIIIYFYGKFDLKKLFKGKRAYIRGILEVMTAFAFLTSLTLMPMADIYTLLNTTPLMITAAGAILLKEKVGIKRWSAVVIGFIGVLIVINPNNLEFGIVFILPILAAIFLTMRDVITKGYKDKSNSLEIILITSLLVTISFGIVSIFFPIYMKFESIFYLFVASIFLTLAYLFSVLTVFSAPLSLTSSTRYSVIVFGIIIGYIFFYEIPSINMIIGAIIISLSGLFVIKREKEIGKID